MAMFANDIIITTILVSLLILLLIAGVIITIFIANRRHVKQEINIAQMQLNYEKELRTVENEVQEQVLINVARELHDNIGQMLTLMNIQIEQEKWDRPDMQQALKPVEETLQSTIQEVRLLGRNLNSDLLEQNGLINTIDNEVNRLKGLDQFTVHWNSDGVEPVLDKNKRVMVYRIFQEMINNMLKHARASNVYIDLQGKDRFSLTVKDDGQGFDMNEAMNKSTSSGLKNILKRASLAELNCNIDAAVGKGCTFTLK